MQMLSGGQVQQAQQPGTSLEEQDRRNNVVKTLKIRVAYISDGIFRLSCVICFVLWHSIC